MSRDGRGSTHAGRPAALPAAGYEPPREVIATATGLAVTFSGDDGRTGVFSISEWPMPGWHSTVAAAFAERVGPAGTRRTLASADTTWIMAGRFLRFLDSLPLPPMTARDLTVAHVDAYMQHRVRAHRGQWGWEELTDLRLLLRQPSLLPWMNAQVLDYLAQRVDVDKTRKRLPTISGYSDGELTRIVDAARIDVAAIRDRIEAGERLLASGVAEPATITSQDADVAEQLAAVVETGRVPRVEGISILAERRIRTALAQRLFVTRADREPLLVLLAAVTGRNCETLKELPAEHRILDGVAVEVRLIKRRRGPRRWYDTVTWEIGPPHRELHTPGGLYLLLHRLMARGRAASGSLSVWSVWRNAHRDLGSMGEVHDPYAVKLAAGLELKQWAARHDLRADDVGARGRGKPLEMRFNRLRTAVEVRRTRSVGGHLPSAARSNTIGVLFANYLRGDATARDWAEEVLGEAVTDAEQAALAVHRSTLADTGGDRLAVDRTGSAGDPAHEGAWNACCDPDEHPTTGRPCRRVSYLDCFHCGNCLITGAHLPAILALLDDLADRRTRLGEVEWWRRYGPVWAAIRRDVLPKFTPAELRSATADKPAEALLELAEDPWEHP